ncbi:MAG: hypothetical protein QM778_00375 [Myxococcales bacterium]
MSAHWLTASSKTGSIVFNRGTDDGNFTSDDLTIHYTLSAATRGTDYTTSLSSSGTVVIHGGSDSVEYDVVGVNDDITEGDETITVNITSVSDSLSRTYTTSDGETYLDRSHR